MLTKLNKREKACLGLLGAGAAALLVSSSIGHEESALFNPEAGSVLRRALAAPIEEMRGLNLVVSGYDTSKTTLPAFYDNFKDVWESITPEDTAEMFYIPKAGGNTFSKVMGKCLGMGVMSAMASTVEGGTDGEQISVNNDDNIGKYVNIDPSTTEGIAKAKNLGAVTSGMVDVVVTQRLEESAELYDISHKGHLFVMLRHPVKRAFDLFYYRQRATWDNFDPDLAKMKIEDYAESDKLIENFMVRSLVGKKSVDVDENDVALAKEILRQKFIVGIAEPTWYDKSVVRFEKYFGWWDDKAVLTNQTVNYCHHREITDGNHFGNHPRALAGSDVKNPKNIISVRNWADMELYAYAKKTLFKQQAVLV